MSESNCLSECGAICCDCCPPYSEYNTAFPCCCLGRDFCPKKCGQIGDLICCNFCFDQCGCPFCCLRGTAFFNAYNNCCATGWDWMIRICDRICPGE